MTPKNAIGKVLLWLIIKLQVTQEWMGGLGHSPHVCVIEPWDPPDPGPWEGVCSSKICSYYQECEDLARTLWYWGG